jgi:ADP-ribosylglycohydrolase
MEPSTSAHDRHLGCLLGLATGDALGSTLEFRSPGTFEPIDDMVGGGPFDLDAGQWTDDTSMALCSAESLLACDGFDPTDQLTRFVRWWREGHWSSTGECFDIGNTVRAALTRFRETGEPYPGPTAEERAGNGSLMRLAPVPMYFSGDPARAIETSARASRTTHGAPQAVDACRYFAGLLVGALQGRPKEELLSSRFSPVEGPFREDDLDPRVDEVASGSFREKEPPAIEGSGYVVRTLEAALWAFAGTGTFEEGALEVVNLGDDADTTGAVYGQIAGAYYTVDEIPDRWLAKLSRREEIAEMARRLWRRSG